ncbi:MAG: UbiA family prenyltransferase [Actinomycetales bacterium]|nr:UbiA family prenyltransferase [Actinomycetales bacterium]
MGEIGARAKYLFLSTHPGPSMAVTTVALVLALSAGLPAGRVVLATLAILANQFSIGLSNDWLDAARDTRASRTDKPLATGRLSPALVRNVAFACVLVSLGLSAALGWWVLLAQVIGIASGWAYNLGAKASPFSFVPYMVGFGILPVIVTLAAPAFAAPWVIAVAAVLGVAAHFANAMPDIEVDRAEGILGLPQRVGARASGIITYIVLVTGATIAFFGPSGAITPTQWIGLGVNVVIAIAGVWLVVTRPPSRLTFQLIMLAALANVVMIAAAGTKILA